MAKLSKIQKEKIIVRRMIEIYCRRKEGNAVLCDECKALIDYAHFRLDHCRFGEAKPTCKRCPIHCYKPEMRDKIRRVMRFSGPRIFFYYPWQSILHSR